MDHVIFDEAVRDSEWRRRVEAQRFFDGRFEVWQRRPVLERRQSLAAHDRVELGLNTLLRLGEEDHGEQERGDARRRLRSQENDYSRLFVVGDLLTDSVPAGEKCAVCETVYAQRGKQKSGGTHRHREIRQPT